MEWNEPDHWTPYADNDDEGAPRRGRPFRELVSVVVSQARPGMSAPRTDVYLIEPDSPMHVPCANPACRNGGLDPIPLARELIGTCRGELRVESCAGRASGESGERGGARCDTMFCVRLCDDDVDDEIDEIEAPVHGNAMSRY